jgi:hypothetical protein
MLGIESAIYRELEFCDHQELEDIVLSLKEFNQKQILLEVDSLVCQGKLKFEHRTPFRYIVSLP